MLGDYALYLYLSVLYLMVALTPDDGGGYRVQWGFGIASGIFALPLVIYLTTKVVRALISAGFRHNTRKDQNHEK